MRRILILSFLALPIFASAQYRNAFSDQVFNLANLLNILLQVLITLAVVLFIWGVIKFILSLTKGDEDGIAKGKKFIVWGIIALFVIASMWAIVYMFRRELGLTENPGYSNLFLPLLPVTEEVPPDAVDYDMGNDIPTFGNPIENV